MTTETKTETDQTADNTPDTSSSGRVRTLTRIREVLFSGPNRALLVVTAVFLFAFFVPFESPRVSAAVQEAFLLLSDYAREHVLLCLIPAFFIAGAISVFLNQQAVIKYLGPSAPKLVAYSVASVSGTILAVCSCTVLPLFKGIYRKGAGLGPAVSFLYSGPAINVLAIILTARVLGLQLGIARAVGAIVFAFVIGLAMHLIFRREDAQRITDERLFQGYGNAEESRSLAQTVIHMASMVGILVFLNWPAPADGSIPFWNLVFRYKYAITGVFAVVLVYAVVRWFTRSELGDWTRSSRDFALQITPLLFGGVLVAGFLLGRPGHPALIPEAWVAGLVGGNSLEANFFASVAGAFMYFATLTEVPIMQGLIGAGMGAGPSLALLLAGPSLSLPSMLVISGELGVRKTLVYIFLVVVLSTIAGLLYGTMLG
jgi:uncharacterized protein